jgi:hypothetical protein
MKDHSARHPAREEDYLAIQASHSARLRGFPKGLTVSPVVIRPVVSPVAVFMEEEAVLVDPMAAVSPEAEAFTVVAVAIDN